MLFGDGIHAKESAEKLEKEYGIKLNTEEREEFIEMCNWSEAHYLNGREDGEILGMAKGKAMGRTEGKAEGKIEEKRSVIHRMNEMGLSIELISTAVALSTAEVLSILS